MNLAQVLAELPALSRLERRELAIRIVEIDSNEGEMGDMAACEHSAALGFGMLDTMEAEDAVR